MLTNVISFKSKPKLKKQIKQRLSSLKRKNKKGKTYWKIKSGERSLSNNKSKNKKTLGREIWGKKKKKGIKS